MDESNPVGEPAPNLSAGWSALGVVLLFVALAAPVFLFWMTGGLESKQIGLVIESEKASATEIRSHSPGPAEAPSELQRHMANAVIVPGQGIGDLRLGVPVSEFQDRLPSGSVTWFEKGPGGLVQNRDIDLGETLLTVKSRVSDDVVLSLTLSLTDCDQLVPGSLPEDGLPRMRDGLSVGSHVSRVVLRLGQPGTGMSSMARYDAPATAMELGYPGVTLSYCPESKIVRAIRVHPISLPETDSAPMIALNRPLAVARATPSEVGSPQTGVFSGRADGRSLLARTDPSDPQSAMPVAWRLPEEPIGVVIDTELPGESLPRSYGRLTRQFVIATLRSNAILGRVANLPQGDPWRPELWPDISDQPTMLAAASGFAPERAGLQTTGATPRAARGMSSPVGQLEQLAALPAAKTVDMAKPQYGVPSRVGTASRIVSALPAAANAAPMEAIPDSLLMLAFASEEAEKDLSLRQRRRVQRRLRLIGYNPRGIDGIFGPRTREAIAALQADEALPVTGYLDPRVREALERRAGEKLATLRHGRRAVTSMTAAAVEASRIPPDRNAPGCNRNANGVITTNQSVSCDVSLLGESLRALFGMSS